MRTWAYELMAHGAAYLRAQSNMCVPLLGLLLLLGAFRLHARAAHTKGDAAVSDREGAFWSCVPPGVARRLRYCVVWRAGSCPRARPPRPDFSSRFVLIWNRLCQLIASRFRLGSVVTSSVPGASSCRRAHRCEHHWCGVYSGWPNIGPFVMHSGFYGNKRTALHACAGSLVFFMGVLGLEHIWQVLPALK